ESCEGWMVSAGKQRRNPACFSNRPASIRVRASSTPSIMPAGPPPAMHTVQVMSAGMFSPPGVLRYANGNRPDGVVAIAESVPFGALGLCSAGKIGGTGAQDHITRLVPP